MLVTQSTKLFLLGVLCSGGRAYGQQSDSIRTSRLRAASNKDDEQHILRDLIEAPEKPQIVPDDVLTNQESHLEENYCDQYRLVRPNDQVQTIGLDYGLTFPDLKELNPHLHWGKTIPVGTPLCVVGQAPGKDGAARGKGLGNRPSDLVQHTIHHGDTCDSIQKRANVDLKTFVELNPKLDCIKLEKNEAVGLTLYLPKDTVVSKKESPNWPPKKPNQDCFVGPWSEWSECDDTAGTSTRFRVIYDNPDGSGTPCPETEQSRPCQSRALEDSDKSDAVDHTEEHRQLTDIYYCPDLYNGCSVPDPIPKYYLFTPACNVHDICWGCVGHPFWAFIGGDKYWCDAVFLDKMRGQCYWKWSGWWQGFDLAYCLAAADTHFSAVFIWPLQGPVEAGSVPHRAQDGCYWWPWEGFLNNAHGHGFMPSWAGCPCEGAYCSGGTCCQYW